MFSFLKQSTASQVRTIGPFVDDTDFKSLENGLTIANTDIKLKKMGGASASKNSGGATADGAGGVYHLTFDATDTATVGELAGFVSVAGALVVTFKFWVLEEAIYDALFGPSAAGFNASGLVTLAAVTHTGATIPTVTTLTNAPSDSSGITTLLSRLPAGLFTGLTNFAQWLGIIAGKQTGNSTARTELRATGAGSGTYDETTDSLEALKDDQMSATEIEDAVWDATLANHLDSGSTGAGLNAAGAAGDPWSTALPGAYGSGTAGKIIGDNINATISSRATPAQVATELGTYDGPTNAEMVARTLAAASYATAAAQTTAQNDLDIITGANGVVIATGTQTFNMTGNVTGNLSGSVGSVSGAVGSVTGAVGSVTGNVGGNVAGSVGSVTGLTASNLDAAISTRATAASIAALNDLSAAEVKTQARTALSEFGAIE